MSDNPITDAADPARQAVVACYPVDGAEVAAELDRIAGLAARLCGTGVGLVSLVEAERQRFIGRSRIELTETPTEQSFCAHAMFHRDAMVVPDALDDPRFAENPLVTGQPGIRFYAGQPLVSLEGVPLGSLCVIDGKPRDGLGEDERQVLKVLADAVMHLLERRRIEHHRDQEERRSRLEIADLEQRFQVLADVMPQLVWSTTPDGMVDYLNRGWCEYTGHSAEASYGARWMQFLHGDDKVPATLCWTRAVESGEDYEIEYRLRHHDGEYRWMLARGVPMYGDNGGISRWIGTCTDIHEQKAAAERLDVLSRELSHRIKNIFAVIGGLIAMTSRNKPAFKEIAVELRDRVLALGRAHDFARSSGGQTSFETHGQLKGLLQTLLSPYQDDECQRLVIAGDDVAIDDRSATPLALFFHELATNAAKYGALSTSDGRVEIDIVKDDSVELVWRETGGPIVRQSDERGFGSSLIEMSIVRQLGGKLDYDWRTEGLIVTASLPPAVLAR